MEEEHAKGPSHNNPEEAAEYVSRGENYVLLKNRNPSENVLHKHFPDIRIRTEFRTLQLTIYFVQRNIMLS